MPYSLLVSSNVVIPKALNSASFAGDYVELRCRRIDRLGDEVTAGREETFDIHVHILSDGLRSGIVETDIGGQGEGKRVGGCRDFGTGSRVD